MGVPNHDIMTNLFSVAVSSLSTATNALGQSPQRLLIPWIDQLVVPVC